MGVIETNAALELNELDLIEERMKTSVWLHNYTQFTALGPISTEKSTILRGSKGEERSP